MNHLKNLEPGGIWHFFEEICRIPRISKHEDEIKKWLRNFASGQGLEFREDETGNILIIREASPGFEKMKCVVLQSHLDMVGEKDSGHPHDWYHDPITPVIRDGWVTADGTTLGADDGIGIAAQLALLSDRTIKTGRLECLFTVDEETGMTGAKNISREFIDGRILINLDSEDEGILFIGCAGGIDTVGRMTVKLERMAPGMTTFRVSLTGLTGGHSGDEIHKGFANSIKLMTRFLSRLSEKYEISLAEFNGGNLRNGIPREAFAVIAVNGNDRDRILTEAEHFRTILKEEFGKLDPGIMLEVSPVDYSGSVMNINDRDRLINMLYACPHGVLAWSKDMDDLVETSTNLAIVKSIGDNEIEIVTTQRSSLESGKCFAARMVESCMKLAGATVTHSEGYPGWKPDINSEILRITRASYKKLFGREPEVKAIHAGLECGLFYEKFPGIDMISFGPTIKGAHPPEERINIETTSMFWELLKDVLRNIPQ
jgi:dipeptidase D